MQKHRNPAMAKDETDVTSKKQHESSADPNTEIECVTARMKSKRSRNIPNSTHPLSLDV